MQQPRATTVKKSFDIYGHYTSVSLEAEFWEALQEIARLEEKSVRSIVLTIDEDRLKSQTNDPNRPPPNLSSRVRVYILNYYWKRS